MPDAITFQHYEVLVRGDGTPWELGRGAMGVTYKALDTNLRVPVALKVIHPRQLDSDLVAQRFVREARAAARLRHPHIAAVYHLGQEGENWFYAMEFVAGDTAEGLVKREGPLPEPIVLTLAVQAARALHAAAALGLVHRDIKPSNLMLTRDGDEWQLKVIDFGLARTFTGSEADVDLAAVTHSGFVGTPYYASPEQLEQKELDIRSDIYSLGVTLWFLLTGKVPFTGSVVSVLSQHLHKAPPFEQLAGCTSPALRGLIERMLAKEPAARPQSALDLRRELEQCLGAAHAGAVTTAPAPVSPAPLPVSEEAIETLMAPHATGAPPAFTPGESQFDAADTVAEFGFGQLCRARERTSGEPFAILRIGPLRGLEESAVAELRQTIERARQIEHPQVWRVHALEADAGESRIVMGWSDGYSWRDLLRRHRELKPDDAFRLLGLAAGGIDAILAAGIDQPDVSLAGLWCEAPAPDTLPIGVKVSPLGILRSFSLDATWIGEGTIAGAGATGPESGAPGAIRGLAQVAYETLGGAMTARGFPPLPSLSEGANKVLRTALHDPGQFASASALVEQLTRAQTEPAPAATFRATTPRQAATQAPTTSVPEPPAPPEVAAESSPEIAPASSADAVEEPPATDRDERPLDEAQPAIATPFVSAAATPWHEPSRPPTRRLVTIAALALLVVGAAWFAWQKRTDRPSVSIGAEPTPAPLITRATPAPVAKPATATPPPKVAVAATPAPATPPPATPPPAPSRTELARLRADEAEEARKQQQWEKAAQRLLAMVREFPESKLAATFDLERLFREVRWGYTQRSDRLPEVTKPQVDALVDEAEAAAALGVPAAMMLLGQHYTPTDWRKAIDWYERATSSTPKAHTRIGLVLANKSPTPENLSDAWQHFQKAEQAGDLDGKISTAECYLYGEMGNPPQRVRGLERDERRGVTMLQEAITAASDPSTPAPHADARRADNAETQPNSAKVSLAAFFLEMETKPEADRPAWYRAEAKTVNHGTRIRQLLNEAKGDRVEAYQQLAKAALFGIGGKKDEREAVGYYKEGKDRGEPSCMFSYARYLQGNTPPASMPPEARDLMIRAARKGNQMAVEFCNANAIAFEGEPAP